MGYSIINGKTVPAGRAFVSAADRGFRYGDGVFEAIAVHHGVPYRLDWHMKRLARGLKAVRIRCSVRGLEKECLALIAKNKVKEGLLRIQVTRGVGGRGYLPEPKIKPTYIVETLPPPEIPEKPVPLWLSSYLRASSALSLHKSCQGLHSTLARLEAADHGCFDALMLNADGEICETSSANIFWIRGRTLYTPPLASGALDGAMRAVVMALSPYPVREIRAGMKTLAAADAVFLTNTTWKVLPVAELKPAGLRWESAGPAALFARRIKVDIEKHCAKKPQALKRSYA